MVFGSTPVYLGGTMTPYYVTPTTVYSKDVIQSGSVDKNPSGEVIKYNINLPAIIVSALVFITVITWVDALNSYFNETYFINPEIYGILDDKENILQDRLASLEKYRYTITLRKFWFAVLITAITIILSMVIFHIFPNEGIHTHLT